MRIIPMLLCCATMLFGLSVFTTTVHAGIFAEDDLLSLVVGPYTYHFNTARDYNNAVWFVGLEWESSSQWEVGVSYFTNSFNQPSGYIYGGKRFVFGAPDNQLFFKITGGPLLGYKRPYDGKIPINYDGIGLGIIPCIGYKHDRVSGQVAILGKSALLFTIGLDIWK